MAVPGRPLAFVLLEVGNLLAILNLGDSPLGADLSAGVAAAMLVLMALVILAVTASRTLQPWLPWVEAVVGCMMIAVAISTLIATQATVGRMVGLAACGAYLVAVGLARRRDPPVDGAPAI